MDANYAGSTIRQTYVAMGTMFKAAKMNDLISKHPMDGVHFTKPVRAKDDIKFLTRKDQRTFLETAQRSHNYLHYALILETGLRTGEMAYKRSTAKNKSINKATKCNINRQKPINTNFFKGEQTNIKLCIVARRLIFTTPYKSINMR